MVPNIFLKKLYTVINGTKVYDPTGQTAAPKYEVGFFPEGGNLVNDIQSKVGFRAVDQYGKGISFDAVLLMRRMIRSQNLLLFNLE
jgi:hypothetical protein